MSKQANYDFNEIKTVSRARALEIMHHFFGPLKITGGVMHISSPIDVNGKSCAVTVEGPGSGMWKDYGAQTHPTLNEVMSHGDMIDMARFKLGIGYYEACNYLGELLGLEQNYKKIDISTLNFCPTLTAGRGYFLSSGISEATIDACSSCLTLAETSESQYIAFLHPNLVNPETIESAHLLYPKRDSSDKNSWFWFNKPVYPWRIYDAVQHKDRSLLIITEGEKDTMACLEAGFNAVSIPSGASNTRWIENSIDTLQLFDEVCIMFDNDVAGLNASRKVMFELSNYRITTSVVNWGYAPQIKDAADVLKCSGADKIKELIDKRTKISLDFSTIVLTGKSEYAIVRIDDRQFTVAELKQLIGE